MTRPLIVAVALDHEVGDVLTTAVELARRLDAPLLPVHSMGVVPWRGVAEVRLEIQTHLAALLHSGVDLWDPHVTQGRTSDRVVEVAAQHGAQMIITGGGGPATLRRWILGSTAEAIVRNSIVPVFVARGPLAMGRAVLCPVDLSPASRMGLTLALRMARAFDSKLTVMHVTPEHDRGRVTGEELVRRVEEDEALALEKIDWFLDPLDTEGVTIERLVTIGVPAERIVEAAENAALLVLGSRGFSLLRPLGLGGVAERAVRFSRSSVLTVRDTDPDREEREDMVRRVADLKTRAQSLMEAGDAKSALPLLDLASTIAPYNAAVHAAHADALAAAGQSEEAEAKREFAELIRERFT